MTVQLLSIFKICLLALLYLFFLRVLRAIWVELREPKPAAAVAAPAPAEPKRAARTPTLVQTGLQFKVIEPAEQRGRTFDLVDELTLGRAPGCHISLDDRFVSQLHARIFLRDGRAFVEDLGSTNGTFLNDQKVTAPALLARGQRIKVGNFVLELQ